ncbi:aldo/keto reductase [Nocardia arizonensis]|uniref:aldo/keto reductase n=1 Tax=Nocardia arizonensis TaxID=1141647 RepID=UPI0012E123C0|nr:aldo/keto reductase [Nocardia arizonensis]
MESPKTTAPESQATEPTATSIPTEESGQTAVVGTAPATTSSRFTIGSDISVNRIGYGTMQLTGPGHWGDPGDIGGAVRILRRAVDLGINHLDTADAYGPYIAENLIHTALHPYPDHLLIATKGGMTRQGPNQWSPVGRPEYLRQCVEMSLRRLDLDCIDLYYLHRIDPHVPLEDQIGCLDSLREQGKIRYIGLSKVTVEQIEAARRITPIAAVQNRFNRTEPDHDVLRHCTKNRIAFVPYAPLAAGAQVARLKDGETVAMYLQWLLEQSPVILPIPGTASLSHLEHNARPPQ